MRQLNDTILSSEMDHMKEIAHMEMLQNSTSASLLHESHEQIKKLKSKVEELKLRLKEAKKPTFSEAIQVSMEEMQRLRDKLNRKNEEIKKLMQDLIIAKTYISSLEKEKYSNKPVNKSVESVKEHIKTIKNALLSNRNMFQMIQSKQHSCDLKTSEDLSFE